MILTTSQGSREELYKMFLLGEYTTGLLILPNEHEIDKCLIMHYGRSRPEWGISFPGPRQLFLDYIPSVSEAKNHMGRCYQFIGYVDGWEAQLPGPRKVEVVMYFNRLLRA